MSTTKFDRSKFKGTSVSNVEAQDRQVAAIVGSRQQDRAGYLTLKEGKNLHRLAPCHPDGGGTSFIEPKSTVFLPMMVDDYGDDKQVKKDAKGNNIKKEGRKPVFNSRVHGGTDKDLVEEYVKLGIAFAENHVFSRDAAVNATEKKKFLDKLNGNFQANINGLTYNHNWVYYAWDLLDPKLPFGIVEAKPSVKTGINRIINVEASNKPIGTDVTEPFTDAEHGRALVTMYNPKADKKKKEEYYSVSLDTTTEPLKLEDGRTVQVTKEYPLSDDHIETLLKFPSLHKSFRNVFRRRDFELQFEGLAYFEEKNGMGIMALPEWEKIFSEIDAYYPEDVTDGVDADEQARLAAEAEAYAAENGGGGDTGEAKSTISDEGAGEPEDNSTDIFALMDRDELKAFNTENKCGILIKPTMKEDGIRERLREWAEATGFVPGAESKPTETSVTPAVVETKTEEAKVETTTPVATEESAAARKLREMRERAGKK